MVIFLSMKNNLCRLGIENLGKVVVTGKDFAANVDCEDQNYFDFSGFADSTFGTSKRLGVTAVDYFDCIRTANDAKTVSTDGATAYISKMYFDSTIVAAYKDSKTAGRFDAVSSSNEHIRMERYTTSYTAYWEDNLSLISAIKQWVLSLLISGSI